MAELRRAAVRLCFEYVGGLSPAPPPLLCRPFECVFVCCLGVGGCCFCWIPGGCCFCCDSWLDCVDFERVFTRLMLG